MYVQEILVGVLFIVALIYVGKMVYGNLQSKNSCGSNCKCGVDFSNINPKKNL